ncbi:MAG: GNAT family N-acetyltransferase [Clostridium sp.]
MVEDLVLLDLIQDSETLKEDFCQRRAISMGQASLSEIPVDTYICYYDKIPVGSCQLFLYNGLAKIEDFTVSPEYQRRGIGTNILKYVIDIALLKKVEVIYLSADEEDTAKEMYKKNGI